MPMRMHGMAYLWMLLAIFLLGLLLGRSLDIYSTQKQREKEAELLHVGALYRDAITAYYENSPGYRKEYPGSLQDLLADPRHLALHRYLRRLYADPLTGNAFATIPAAGGGIRGVYSTREGRPVKQAGFAPVFADFTGKDSYHDWRFQAGP